MISKTTVSSHRRPTTPPKQFSLKIEITTAMIEMEKT